MLSWSRATLVTMLLALAATAHADGWLVLETPAAFAVSDTQEGLFKPGAMPAIGAYVGNARGAVGLRLRAGVLANSAASADPYRDPGVGGLASAGVAVRIPLPGGVWLEAVGGAGVTGHNLEPVIEAGVGWMVRAGGVDLGPSARIVRVIADRDMDTLGSATIVAIGLDLRIGHAAPVRHRAVVAAAPRPAAPRVAEPPPTVIAIEADDERIVDRDEACTADLASCEFARQLRAQGASIQNDRIVLDERVLFDTDRARVKHAGRDVIGLVVREWARHPEWTSIRIEGHADVRGPDGYNLWLSQLRADRVAAVFAGTGIAAARLSTIGFGRSRPRFAGTSELSHHLNRRVELVVVREGSL